MLSELNKKFTNLFMEIDKRDTEFYSKNHTEEEESLYLEKTFEEREEMKDLAVQVALEINRVIKEAADDIPDYYRTVEDCNK